LSCKIIANDRILSFSIIVPPLLALNQTTFTISCKLFLLRSAFSYLYLGLRDLFSSKLSNSNRASKNYWASCCPYPKNLDFLAPTAALMSLGVSEREVELRINWTSFPYEVATRPLELIYLVCILCIK
jgi:hypothetical protein